MKNFLIALLTLTSISAYSRCSDVYESAFLQADRWGLNLAENLAEASSHLSDEAGIVGTIIGAPIEFAVRVVTFPYLIVEDHMSTTRISNQMVTEKIMYGSKKNVDLNWLDFAASIVQEATDLPERPVTIKQGQVIAQVMQDMDEKEELCKITRPKKGGVKVRFFKLKKLKKLIVKKIVSQDIDLSEPN